MTLTRTIQHADRSGIGFALLFSALALPALSAPPEDISADLAGIVERSGVPALAAAAVVREDIVAAGASGVRKLGADVEVTIEDQFHIGSNTKSMTATLAALLVRDGTIRWDTTVGESFKGFRVHDHYEDVTLEQLLSNLGGAPGTLRDDQMNDLFDLGKRRWDPTRHREAFAKMILQQREEAPPVGEYVYSNAGFSLAGAMLERAADQPWEGLLRDRIFKPLAMTSAGFRAPGSNHRIDQPFGHVIREGGRLTPVNPEPFGDNPRAIAPAGAVHCSILDHARYARAHLGYGPKGFLTTGELTFLHRPRQQEHPYGLGWAIDSKQPWAQGPALSHSGSNNNWYSVIWVAPKRGFAAVAAVNRGGEEARKACNDAVLLLLKHLPE